MAAVALSFPRTASAQFTQQGNKLVGSGGVGAGQQGSGAAISGDGNTTLVGGYLDNSGIGAAWVFTRSGGSWSQQTQLIGTGATGAANQGYATALSDDGNVAVVGGKSDNSGRGAAWIFTRSGSTWDSGTIIKGSSLDTDTGFGTSVAVSADGSTVIVGGPGNSSFTGAAWIFVPDGLGGWTEQTKLVGTGGVAGLQTQGVSVALSADGNTAIIGGNNDNSSIGAAWVFTRSSNTWSQQQRLVANNSIGESLQGQSVAISSDGNTALIGGPSDGLTVNTGATWVWTRSGGTWTQQAKLVGTGAVGVASQGIGVALSADGKTAIASGYTDDSSIGAVWVFVNSAGTWSQQGTKLSGSDVSGNPVQGFRVGLSDDGNTAIWGGTQDNSQAGAAWVFVQAPVITGLVPDVGLGGTATIIHGSHFTGATSVTFGGASAGFVVNDDSTIAANAPSHALGAVDVVITTPHGEGTGVNAFGYFVAPTINSVTPNTGSTGGGTSVDISGSGFTGTSAVSFGGTSVTTFNVMSDGHISAVTAAHTAGAVDVFVITPGGGNTLSNGFTYFVPAPTVTSINPNTGTTAGGVSVRIVGTNLTGATAVKFGTTASTSFSVLDSATVTATAPAHAAGAVNVTVTTPGGTSTANTHNLFTYTAVPKIAELTKFTGGTHDGGKPFGGLIADKAGALYGTTSVGGTHNKGTVFKMTPPAKGKTAWTKTILHSFAGSDGAAPYAGLIADPKGVMYGTATAGGAHNKGVVFKITATGAYTTLYSFTGGASDGGIPFGGLVRDSKGALHGVTTVGGTHNHGTLFKIGPTSFVPAVQHNFASGAADGAAPHGTLIVDKTNNLYGTAIAGGTSNAGVLFKLTSTGTFSVLHTFTNVPDGKAPYGGVVIDKNNVLYGVTIQGGKQAKGAAFELTPPSSYVETFNFSGTSGINPYASPVLDANKVMYGTTFTGGATNHGAVFRILPPANGQSAPSQGVMYSFKGGTADGANPYGSVLIGKNGVLYGTASAGGGGPCTGGCGTVFMLTY